jgi:hypothetical protein
VGAGGQVLGRETGLIPEALAEPYIGICFAAPEIRRGARPINHIPVSRRLMEEIIHVHRTSHCPHTRS